MKSAKSYDKGSKGTSGCALPATSSTERKSPIKNGHMVTPSSVGKVGRK